MGSYSMHSFLVWLRFLSIVIFGFICVVYTHGSFPIIAGLYSTVWIYHSLSSAHLLMDIWVAPGFWLLRMKLLWTFIYRSLIGFMRSLLLGKSLRVTSWITWQVYVSTFQEMPPAVLRVPVPPVLTNAGCGQPFLFRHSNSCEGYLVLVVVAFP